MSKKRTIMPNTKVDKNNIGKQGLRFNEVYADNIITDKINNKKVDPDYYLKDNFCIIYPNGGSKEAPANIVRNSYYIEENPFPGFYVYCEAEIQLKAKNGNYEWGKSGWWINYGNGHGNGTRAFQHNNNNIVIVTGTDNTSQSTNEAGCSFAPQPSYNVSQVPCRVLVWKVGKISDDN